MPSRSFIAHGRHCRRRKFQTATQRRIRRDTKRLHGIANRPVAGAAAEIATQAIRIEFAVARTKLLREHADHKARSAVSALRSPVLSHRALYLAKRARFRQSFNG